MRLTDEMVLQDNERFKKCNALAELKYCGWEVPHRKSITNDEIHFHAWLFRSAVELLKEQEAKKVIESTNIYTGLPITHCPKCGVSIDRYLYGRQHEGQTNYCPFCGQAVKWE